MSQISRKTGCKAIITDLKQSVGFPPSGGMPCVATPVGGTIEPSAEVEIDAQKREIEG